MELLPPKLRDFPQSNQWCTVPVSDYKHLYYCNKVKVASILRMTLPSPELFRFSNNEDYSNVSSDVWKISTPSLPWSILLSYLIYSEEIGSWTPNYELLSEVNSFKGRLKINNTNLEFDQTSIRNSVQEFNPFLSDPSIYSDKNVTVLLRLVDLKLRSFAKIHLETSNDEFLIKAAARMLDCQIVVRTDCSGTTNVTSYGKILKERVPKLVLFLKKEIENGEESVVEYAFGMSLAHSASLRSDAMKYLFDKAEVDYDDICQIERRYKDLQETCIPFTDNFLRGITFRLETYRAKHLQDSLHSLGTCWCRF
ncbi:hypothetical protein JTE90_014448 [Oedothorax gibbosus]|uniref:Uncharacterized protein n=1 Tax=Oedothorax gibbosus TaxID=931172 RepID=A0AAV6V377_9ARAC|nr:hypothetical protein JTE90_014448 [Oedothorax gibbosus]